MADKDSYKDLKWDGVDFDGTLSKYDGWKGHEVFGEPVVDMCEFVRKEHEKGRTIRIFTARVSQVSLEGYPKEKVVNAIQDWCEKNIGFRPEVTCEKDRWLDRIYDDRAIGVVKNEGILINPKDEKLEEFLSKSKRN